MPFGHPVSINFGRPDIETYITETVKGTAEAGRRASAHSGDVEAPGGEKRLSSKKVRTARQFAAPGIVSRLEHGGGIIGWLAAVATAWRGARVQAPQAHAPMLRQCLLDRISSCLPVFDLPSRIFVCLCHTRCASDEAQGRSEQMRWQRGDRSLGLLR